MALLSTLRSGHWPSLAGAWLHLTVSFMVWLLIGAMSIPLAEELQLRDAEIAWLVALPLLGGAVLRIVAGWSADWMGAYRTAVTIMLIECGVLVWGWLGVTEYREGLAFAACLGIAGASFAVSLPLASRAYPPAAQGFVLGLAASGNVGTVLILFLAPWGAQLLGWHGVCGLMAVVAAASLALFTVLLPAQPDRPGPPTGRWWHSAARLVQGRAAYWLCFLYAITFGGFVGLCSVLPLMLHEVYGLQAVTAGAIAALCGLGGSLLRPVGGHIADRRGGLQTLHYVLPVAAGGVVAILSPSFSMAVTMMILTTGALGFGNGVVFQLVAEWFPKEIGLASGVVGAAGGIGGFCVPVAVGMLKGPSGNYDFGLWLFAGCVMCAWGTVIAAIRRENGGSTAAGRR
ncbi:MAG TPA: MFS transporter [Nitrospira sp.]|jgi:NNP family nitrate/nitrite transporter-like MFS transporter|nr:MFS transporter [Nitrospira sp.]